MFKILVNIWLHHFLLPFSSSSLPVPSLSSLSPPPYSYHLSQYSGLFFCDYRCYTYSDFPLSCYHVCCVVIVLVLIGKSCCYVHLIIWNRCSHWTQILPIQLEKGPSVIAFLNAGTTGVCLGSNAGDQACVWQASLSQLSHLPTTSSLFKLCKSSRECWNALLAFRTTEDRFRKYSFAFQCICTESSICGRHCVSLSAGACEAEHDRRSFLAGGTYCLPQ